MPLQMTRTQQILSNKTSRRAKTPIDFDGCMYSAAKQLHCQMLEDDGESREQTPIDVDQNMILRRDHHNSLQSEAARLQAQQTTQ